MIRLFAAHRTAANVLMLAILLLGVITLPKLQRDTFPVIPPTLVEARIQYPGATPADVEETICKVVEVPLRAIDFLRELQCDARDNLAVVTAEKDEQANMQAFYDDVKSAVESISDFPARVEKPQTRIVERQANVATLAISGAPDAASLFRYASDVAERLRGDPVIASVALNGFSEREIVADVDSLQLRRLGITLSELVTTLQQQNIDVPAGSVASASGELSLRFNGKSQSLSELGQLPVVSATLGSNLRLQDIATLREQFSDDSHYALFNGERAALVTVYKTELQDALRVMARVQSHLERERAAAPPGISLTISGDTTANIKDRLRLISSNGLQGLLLVCLAMWLFFGFRFSFWVAMGLPVSFLGTIFLMNLFGFTINTMTMVALLVAIGLLMDDAIVISENIIARFHSGETAVEAAVNGTRQVAAGVLSSFLTTAMIVGPLGFMSGQLGAVLKFIPVVLLMTLLVSLLEAFFILPNHLQHSLKAAQPGRIQQTVNGAFARLRDSVIVPLARVALRWRYLTLGLAICAVLVSLAPFTAGLIKFQNFPTLESDTVEARLTLPMGTPAARTEQRLQKVISALASLNDELSPAQPGGAALIRNITVTLGSNADVNETGPHLATVSADLLRADQRNSTVPEIIDRWKKLTGQMPDLVALRFTDRERGVGGKPIDIRLQSDDYDTLKQAAREMRKFFRGFDGVRDVSDDLSPGKREYVVTLKHDSASAQGITAAAVAEELRQAFNGDTGMSQFDRFGELDMVMRLKVDGNHEWQALQDLPIKSRDGEPVPLSTVATLSETRSYSHRLRIDGQRTVSVVGSIDPKVANARELISAFNAQLRPQFQQRFPDLRITVAGEAKDSSVTGSSLQQKLLIGAIGVFMILSVQFRSFIQPVAVLIAIPLSLVGVMWGHVLLGLNLSMPSLVGLATLAGVVVNDSILLVSFIKARLANGADILEACVGSVADRFRAIFLTSLTTVIGLGPLLFEMSTQAQFLRPIVASLAFGLSSATLLALLVTPAVFAILHDFGCSRSD